jgi:hypothetical protein
LQRLGGVSLTVRLEGDRDHHGWQPYKVTNFDLTETAFQVEQTTLRWLRKTRQLPPALNVSAMPQGGWTETVNAEHIDPETLWRKALSIKRKTM